jgi:serine/threonine protein kinase
LVTGAAFSPKSDVWSVGIVLYQMLTLELPFVGRTLPQLAVKIQAGLYETPRGRSAELLHVLRTCLTLVGLAHASAPARTARARG